MRGGIASITDAHDIAGTLVREIMLKHASIVVRAFWDSEAGVWVASSADIDGLSVEAETIEALNVKVLSAITDLIELNGIDSELAEIPVHLLAEQFSRLPNPSH